MKLHRRAVSLCWAILLSTCVCRVLDVSILLAEPTHGPLRAHATNGRYFADASGHAIYLTGSHSWDSLRDWLPRKFDFDRYLDLLSEKNHNFIRLWVWDLPKFDATAQWDLQAEEVAPFPWRRTGPGTAVDGREKFDLSKFNPDYFQRLRSRVIASRDRGIYVSIMLFEGWNMHRLKDPASRQTHPFSGANNVNGIDVLGDAIYSLSNSEAVRIQEAYVRKVVDTVNDLDNVLYEIINEAHPDSSEWQYHLIKLIHEYESQKEHQHPVGMTHFGGSTPMSPIVNSSADWISPGGKGYYANPPATQGRQVVIADSDHIRPLSADHPWVWKSFCRGMNVILMDCFTIDTYGTFERSANVGNERCRSAMGHARSFADRIDLDHALPHSELSSTGYCLAVPGQEYLVYQPKKDAFTVELEPGTYEAQWFDPVKGITVKTETISAVDRRHTFRSEFAHDSVLYLKSLRFHGLSEVNPPASPGSTTPIAIVGARLIDGLGGRPIADSIVIIKGDTIVAAGPRSVVTIPEDARRVDASGATLLPGLVDSHLHVGEKSSKMNKLPAMVLSHGTTTARDPGRPIDVYQPIKDSSRPMPRMFLTGPHFDQDPPAWPNNAILLESPDKASEAVRRFHDEGASAIKVYFRLPLDGIQATCETSHELGIPVTAHLELIDADRAINAGLDGIEHITSFGTSLADLAMAKQFRAMVDNENEARNVWRYRLWASLDLEHSPRVQPLLDLLRQRRTFVSPTLGVFERRDGDKDAAPYHVQGFLNMLRFTGLCHQAGVTVVVGSHTWVPHADRGWAFQREMELLVQCGLTPLEVISAATRNNAEFLGCADRLGSVVPGKLADLVLVDGDPTEDMHAMYNVRRVMLNGDWVDAPEADSSDSAH